MTPRAVLGPLVLAGGVLLAACADEPRTEVGTEVPRLEPAEAAEEQAPTATLESFVWEAGQRGFVNVGSATSTVSLVATSWEGTIVWRSSVGNDAASRRIEIAIDDPGYYRLTVNGADPSSAFVVIPVNDVATTDPRN